MSGPLNLIAGLLDRGRNFHEAGRDREARRVLLRVVGLPELPAAATEETLVRLAEIALNRRQYRRARRYLAAVLKEQPANARYHFLMAGAVDAEDTGDPRRAARHYRRSLELEPNQPDCLLALGLLRVREGRIDAGLGCLCRAVELAPADPEIIREAVNGFTLAGREEEARAILRAAMFRQPRDGRFRQLWMEYQFRQLANEQQARRTQQSEQTEDDPVLLPFTLTGSVEVGGRIVRQDGPSPLPPPQGPRPAQQRSDQRKAL